MRVLNIEVTDDLVRAWAGWFAPEVQPFLVEADSVVGLGPPSDAPPLSDEVRDTLGIYALPDGIECVWLDEAEFSSLRATVRTGLVHAQRRHGREHVPSVRSWEHLVGQRVRRQAGGHRFVWWPSLLDGHEERVLTRHLEDGRRSSRHDEVPAAVWDAAARLLPRAGELAGSFPARSGPNCFGTVMAATGVEGADEVWMLREPFEEWLARETRPGGSDDAPGTVLVWRSPDGLAQHAAVTLGGGWALHKPSQGWMSPVKVLSTRECKASSRGIGRRLQRHRLVSATHG